MLANAYPIRDGSVGLSRAIFNAQNSTIGQKFGVLWIISSESVGVIAPNFSA